MNGVDMNKVAVSLVLYDFLERGNAEARRLALMARNVGLVSYATALDRIGITFVEWKIAIEAGWRELAAEGEQIDRPWLSRYAQPYCEKHPTVRRSEDR